jgi:hypothetical protein
VRLFVVMMQQPVLLSPNFGMKSLHIFTLSLKDVTVVCRIDCLACQDEFFVKNSRDGKGNYEHTLDFALRLSCLFQSAPNRVCHSNTHVRLILSSLNACLIITRVTVALFPRFAQHLMLTFCQIHHKIASGQRNYSK